MCAETLNSRELPSVLASFPGQGNGAGTEAMLTILTAQKPQLH